MSGVVNVAAMTPAHAAQVLEIYRSGIDGGDATFETGVPSWEECDAARMVEHRLVALDGFDRVLGWAAVARVSERSAAHGTPTAPPSERPAGPPPNRL
ncbi:GNAT family N-acetyltransferase [Kitasatospora sp. NPDC091257]|uniref:GNAT family N-acetyltransferase n=1 Tax=Kitasatospora sp. NPDC091257 TaxID=3364084 RepID=UPI0037FBBAFB